MRKLFSFSAINSFSLLLVLLVPSLEVLGEAKCQAPQSGQKAATQTILQLDHDAVCQLEGEGAAQEEDGILQSYLDTVNHGDTAQLLTLKSQ